MKIAAVQSSIYFENKEYNLKKAETFFRYAAERGADIILFPEMSFTGFSVNTAHVGESDAYTVDYIRTLCVKFNISAGFGYVKLCDNKGENHYLLLDNKGNILSDYIKIHSFSIGGECGSFRSGNSLPCPVSICGMRVSTFICYDLRFPEIFRACTDNTDIFVVAANWPKSRREHWLALLKARAIENQAYVIGINCTGQQGNISYCGDSTAFDPLGNIVSSAASDAEETVIFEIQNNVTELRRDFPALESRKFDLYSKLYLNNL